MLTAHLSFVSGYRVLLNMSIAPFMWEPLIIILTLFIAHYENCTHFDFDNYYPIASIISDHYHPNCYKEA